MIMNIYIYIYISIDFRKQAHSACCTCRNWQTSQGWARGASPSGTIDLSELSKTQKIRFKAAIIKIVHIIKEASDYSLLSLHVVCG